MSKPSATLVGVFVLGAIALIVAGVLFFGSGVFLAERIRFVSFFPGSVAGLQEGTAVTFRGVRVGQVKSIGIRFNPDTGSSIIQVNMELLPETVIIYGTPLREFETEVVPALVQRGLTAQLVVQSFLTGLLNVDLDFRPGVEASRLGLSTTPEVPTVPSDLEAITRKLESIDIAGAIESVERTLASMNELLESPELRQTINDLPGLVSTLRHTLNTVDREVAALSGTGREVIASSAADLQKTLASVQALAASLERETASTLGAARGMVDSADTALDGANVLLDPRGRTLIQVQRAVDDLAAAAARLRNLSERVDRDPSILLRGR